MTVYSVVLFIHVASAIALFIALAAESAILLRIRSAQSVEEMRFFIGTFQRLRIIGIPAFLGILLGGLYLGSKFGSGTYWIPLSLAATVVIMLLGGLVNGRRISRLSKALSSDATGASIDVITAETSAKAKDDALLISYGLRVGLGLGVVFMMTAKPELVLSIVGLGVSCIIGLFVARGIRKIADRPGRPCEQWGRATRPLTQRS
jgi:hypothetical protein